LQPLDIQAFDDQVGNPELQLAEWAAPGKRQYAEVIEQGDHEIRPFPVWQ
jgi:hypothetical protein